MTDPGQGSVRRLTHASFFSGVGGMDIGLERAGWQTVSFSEIEPYPCAVLAERWPEVPNLGDITRVVDVPEATLWSGGFPCQDLSVAGKRKGFTGERSVLAFTFLDLVEQHRPPAFILENVPGLLSSNGGRDFGRLLGEVGNLGYRWAYRVLDAQWFGLPQRRRRVFILALDAGRHPHGDGPAEVLAVGASCGRDHQAERAAWAASTGRPIASPARPGLDIAGNLTRRYGKGINSTIDDGAIVYGAPSDAAGMRAADGLARRLDDQRQLVADTGAVTSLSKSFGAGGPDAAHAQAGWLIAGKAGAEDDLLPQGLDSARYRAIGNGVASPVAEWIGRRLADYLNGRRPGV